MGRCLCAIRSAPWFGAMLLLLFLSVRDILQRMGSSI
jgi:hypothetical protein